MDDATRKQVETALEKFSGGEKLRYIRESATPGDTVIDAVMVTIGDLRRADEALTALKAIQPRPDVVEAARALVDRIKRYPNCSAGYTLDNDGGALEAALADEQEWEVMHGAFVDGDLVPVSPEYPGAFPIHVPKSVLPKPPVSREKAIEDAAKHAREILSELLSEWGAVAHDDMRDCAAEIDAALSREVQP